MRYDPIVLVSDKDPKEKKRSSIIESVSNTLWTGFFAGFGVCLSLMGMLQYFHPVILQHSEIADIVRKYWFHLEWFYWVIPIILFIILFIYTKRTSIRKMNKKLVDEK